MGCGGKVVKYGGFFVVLRFIWADWYEIGGEKVVKILHIVLGCGRGPCFFDPRVYI